MTTNEQQIRMNQSKNKIELENQMEKYEKEEREKVGVEIFKNSLLIKDTPTPMFINFEVKYCGDK